MVWGDPQLLDSIHNPSSLNYEVSLESSELSFYGAPEQPDFGTIKISLWPTERVPELKSVKKYLHSFRTVYVSYERLTTDIYNDFWRIYNPNRLIVEITFNPRGGISSYLRVDSEDNA